MKTIYSVVQISDADDFGDTVTEMLKDGWKLYGSPYATHDGITGEDGQIHSAHCQAMTKEEADEE